MINAVDLQLAACMIAHVEFITCHCLAGEPVIKLLHKIHAMYLLQNLCAYVKM